MGRRREGTEVTQGAWRLLGAHERALCLSLILFLFLWPLMMAFILVGHAVDYKFLPCVPKVRADSQFMGGH